MIWEWLIKFIADRVVAFFDQLRGLIPDPPAFFAQGAALAQGLIDWVRPVSAWVDFGMGVTVVGAVAVVWGVALAIKIARIVASFVTLGGGAAG